MMRKLSFGFVVVFVTAFIVVACGRQVTPNPPGLGPGGAPPGYIAIHFDTAATFNFSQYQYMIVFNTSGSGVTPSTQTLQTNWAGYSYALVAYGNGAVSAGRIIQYVPPKVGHGPPGYLGLLTTPQQFSYNPNSNGTGTEFSMLAQKQIFVSPSPSPSATPPSKWTFNAFTVGPGQLNALTFVDSLGAGGYQPPEYVSPTLCMNQQFDNTYFPQGNYIPNDPGAQIISIEISNNPLHPGNC
ncbi:MAG: hypothetical protein JO351_11330 [Candidatus Eremiobacteraeota bacterium]|nr:hypothetical protein [Candidatus Eremiobacteraeota bacterium]